MKESDMYPPLKQWLEDQGYTVYPEIVPPQDTMRRADIVAVKDERITIIEMKTGMSLRLLDQAWSWVYGGWAYEVLVAIPFKSSDKAVPTVAYKIMNETGIGLFEIHDNSRVIRSWAPKQLTTTKRERELLDFLTPHHLNGPAAGSKTGGHISAHRLTMIRAQEYLAAAGDWVTPKQIVENIETHYFAYDKAASLRQALLQWGNDFCEYQVINRRGMFRIKGM